MTERKKNILKTNNKIFMNWEFWRKKNIFYHEQDIKYLKFLIPENKKILDLGCGTGYKLNALNPSKGTGIDFSNEAIKIAKKNYKQTQTANYFPSCCTITCIKFLYRSNKNLGN